MLKMILLSNIFVLATVGMVAIFFMSISGRFESPPYTEYTFCFSLQIACLILILFTGKKEIKKGQKSLKDFSESDKK